MELKCTCDHCKQPLEFPAEMTGQIIACPHCKTDTILFNPTQLAKPKLLVEAEKQAAAETFEDRLESIGDNFHTVGIIAVLLCVLAAIPVILFAISGNGNFLLLAGLAAIAIPAYVQGVIVQVLFYSIAKHLRLQSIIANTVSKTNK